MRLLDDGTKAYLAALIAASNTVPKAETMEAIRTVYNCMEGDLGAYQGMQLVRGRIKRTITISQPGYLKGLRERFGITSTLGPLQFSFRCCSYQAIGTRPEVQYATNTRSRYINPPLRDDMVTLDRVLDYLVNTLELRLVLGGHGGVVLYATVDASYGTHEGRKSHSGCPLHIGEGSGAFLSRCKSRQ